MLAMGAMGHDKGWKALHGVLCCMIVCASVCMAWMDMPWLALNCFLVVTHE
jgi:hypothetical protein